MKNENSPDIKRRLLMMSKIAFENTSRIAAFLKLEQEKKICGIKKDGTAVTIVDYENNLNTLRNYLAEFPGDSFDGEEMCMLRPRSKYVLLEDPIDATTHAEDYACGKPKHKYWPTHMLSLLENGEPVAFTLGVPLRKEIYFGSVSEGISQNGHPFHPKRSEGGLIVQVNENEHENKLREICGHSNVHIAGLCGWLILQGMTSGGVSPFHLPHESSCIAAIAKCAGAKTANFFGGAFQPYNKMSSLVWAFEPETVESVVNKALQR